MTEYEDFIAGKSWRDVPSGMDRLPPLPIGLKPFQRAIVGWALRRGRAALFEATGLGKTIQQLAWARAVADEQRGPVLILTPLAVAEQTVAEAARFGISNVSYAADKRRLAAITVTNYERFEAAKRGWVRQGENSYRLSGAEGAKTTIGVLDLAELEIEGGGRLRLSLQDATPASMKRLGELFEVLAGVVKPGKDTIVEFEVSEPDDNCLLIKTLKERRAR